MVSRKCDRCGQRMYSADEHSELWECPYCHFKEVTKNSQTNVVEVKFGEYGDKELKEKSD